MPHLKAGTIKRVHVDQARIKQARKEGTDIPTLTIQTSRRSIKARRVTFYGMTELVQSLQKPLSCGARVWIETRGEVEYE